MVSCRHNLDSFEQKRMLEWWVCVLNTTILSTDAIIVSGRRLSIAISVGCQRRQWKKVNLLSKRWLLAGLWRTHLHPPPLILLTSAHVAPLPLPSSSKRSMLPPSLILFPCLYLQILHNLILNFGSFSFPAFRFFHVIQIFDGSHRFSAFDLNSLLCYKIWFAQFECRLMHLFVAANVSLLQLLEAVFLFQLT